MSSAMPKALFSRRVMAPAAAARLQSPFAWDVGFSSNSEYLE